MVDIVAIKKYMELDGDRKCSIAELKRLSAEDKAELGPMARAELSKRGIV